MDGLCLSSNTQGIEEQPPARQHFPGRALGTLAYTGGGQSGSCCPHEGYWLPFFAVLTAMRVLTVWVYSNTQSLLLAQLMHASPLAFGQWIRVHRQAAAELVQRVGAGQVCLGGWS